MSMTVRHIRGVAQMLAEATVVPFNTDFELGSSMPTGSKEGSLIGTETKLQAARLLMQYADLVEGLGFEE